MDNWSAFDEWQSLSCAPLGRRAGGWLLETHSGQRLLVSGSVHSGGLAPGGVRGGAVTYKGLRQGAMGLGTRMESAVCASALDASFTVYP